MKRETIVDIIAGLLTLLFLYTGVMKIIDHDVFLEAMLKSNQLRHYAKILSVLVPLGELLIVVSLLIPATKKTGLLSSFVLMGIFTIYVGIMIFFRTDAPCSCGGIMHYLNWHEHFYLNTVMTVLAFIAFQLHKNSRLTKDKSSAIYA